MLYVSRPTCTMSRCCLEYCRGVPPSLRRRRKCAGAQIKRGQGPGTRPVCFRQTVRRGGGSCVCSPLLYAPFRLCGRKLSPSETRGREGGRPSSYFEATHTSGKNDRCTRRCTDIICLRVYTLRFSVDTTVNPQSTTKHF